MDASLVVLKLILDSLGEADSIASVNDRLRLQKAIYLTQVAGLNLGYSYSWYLKGPYSTSLTRDYYQLTEEKAVGDTSFRDHQLNPIAMRKLSGVKELLTQPANINLAKPHWYELLASMHYLMRNSGYTYEKACQVLKDTKPHLRNYLDKAAAHLKKFRLI